MRYILVDSFVLLFTQQASIGEVQLQSDNVLVIPCFTYTILWNDFSKGASNSL